MTVTNTDQPLPKTTRATPVFRGDNIIAVASGKGGVGKTWFSITFAHALAKAGKKILLFDGDLGLANVDVQLGITPKYDLRQVIEGKVTLEQAIEKCPDTGFDILAGQSGSGNLASMPIEEVINLRDQLLQIAKNYDYLVIDLGAGIDRPVRILASSAKTVFIVVNEEPTSLTDAYAFIKLTHAAGLSDSVNIVVNEATNRSDGEKVFETLTKVCNNFLKFRPHLAGIIRLDKMVPEAIRNQTPLLTRHPNTNAAFDIEVMSKAFLGNE
jgi:flagellar biosynthesis protein FlhG